jgi:MoaA/NifB/PqqE/SkfB family radical SAM enzyme
MKHPAFYSPSHYVEPRLLWHGARRLWAYYRDTPTNEAALGAVWEITNACDADCSFCGTHALRKRFGERTRDEVIRIAAALARSGARYVNVSGGEPLMAKHVFTAMDRLREDNVRLTLNTNGSRVAELVDELVGRISVITISLDSIDAAEHDRIRRKEGLTALIHRGIDAIRAHPQGDSVSVRLRSVISPDNFRQIVPFVEAMRDRVDEVCFQPMQDGGPDDIHRGIDAFTPELEAPFRATIDELIHRFPEFDTFYCRRMADFLFHPDRVRNDFHCLIPTLLFRCLSNGDVVLCSNGTTVVGNLLSEEVKDVFNRPAFAALRSASRRQCRTCLCWVQPLKLNAMVPSWVPQLIPIKAP